MMMEQQKQNFKLCDLRAFCTSIGETISRVYEIAPERLKSGKNKVLMDSDGLSKLYEDKHYLLITHDRMFKIDWNCNIINGCNIYGFNSSDNDEINELVEHHMSRLRAENSYYDNHQEAGYEERRKQEVEQIELKKALKEKYKSPQTIKYGEYKKNYYKENKERLRKQALNNYYKRRYGIENFLK